MFCKHCGNALESDAAYCPHCGNAAPGGRAQTPPPADRPTAAPPPAAQTANSAPPPAAQTASNAPPSEAQAVAPPPEGTAPAPQGAQQTAPQKEDSAPKAPPLLSFWANLDGAYIRAINFRMRLFAIFDFIFSALFFVWGVVMLFLPLLPVPEKYIVCAGLVLIAVVGLIPGIRKLTSLNREIRSIENDPPKILYEIHDGSYDLTAYNHGEKTGTSKTFLNEIYKKRELGQTKIFALYLNYDEQVNYIDARALPPEGLALLRRLLKMP